MTSVLIENAKVHFKYIQNLLLYQYVVKICLISMNFIIVNYTKRVIADLTCLAHDTKRYATLEGVAVIIVTITKYAIKWLAFILARESDDSSSYDAKNIFKYLRSYENNTARHQGAGTELNSVFN